MAGYIVPMALIVVPVEARTCAKNSCERICSEILRRLASLQAGNVSRNNANLDSVSAPTQAEAITIGRNDRFPRQQILSNQRISRVNNNSSISNFGPA